MLEWNDYIEQLLSRESSFDGVSLSFDDHHQTVGVPAIIKASVLMLDRMLECQGKFNILVFPERIQSIFIFTLVKLLYNISEGRIDSNYNPEAFHPGEKLRFGKAVVEFIGTEVRDGQTCMKLQLADLTTSAPVTYFPLFQKTTAQKLSKYKSFDEARKDADAKLRFMSPDEKHLKLLADHKTHMDSSIVNMTSIINTKELISKCKLCGQKISDILLIGQADYEGNVRNVGAGQMGGTPAIVLASDLYAIAEMARKGHPIQSIIIDGSNANALLSQMDALDDLMQLGVPVTCVTDIVNSFDLQPFLDRKFNLWRWDKQSITKKLYGANQLAVDQKTEFCATRELEHLVSDGNEISIAIQKLSFHRGETKQFSAHMLKVFDKLSALAFSALRETVPLDETVIHPARQTLNDCSNILESEKPYLASAIYNDYSQVVNCLKAVFTRGFSFPKHEALAARLKAENYSSICIVVPERSDKSRVQEYWQTWCRRKLLQTRVSVAYPAEYYPVQCMQYSATIVVGWLKRAIMRKILYGFNTKVYTVLLYDYEKRWKNYDTARWNSALDISRNREIIERSFATDKIPVSTTRFTPSAVNPEETPNDDEYSEIEVVLRDNKYHRYVANGGQKAADQTIEAIPVNFVGGYLAFFGTGHKVLTVTNIIVNDADKIKEDDKVLPEHLKLGDFVVIREADHDLIKEMADVLLERDNKAGLRKMATKWKESLEIEQLFYSADELIEKMRKAGCTRGEPTMRSWLQDDDIIAPQSIDDLKMIARVTESGVLKAKLEEVFAAAKEVRIAHMQAGTQLSRLLRQRIVNALDNYGDIDPFNIWEPIELQIDGVGTVRILKIIDIGSPVIVDKTDTNRLIDDE